MMYKIDVAVTAPVHDTEVTDRVADAILNLFPTAEIEERPGELVATAHSIEQFSELLHRRRILATARDVFLASLHGNSFSFSLSKQPAFAGVATFTVGNPSELGDLDVTITVHEPDVETFIDHLAPETDDDGKPID